jgi:hypothetical protein
MKWLSKQKVKHLPFGAHKISNKRNVNQKIMLWMILEKEWFYNSFEMILWSQSNPPFNKLHEKKNTCQYI